MKYRVIILKTRGVKIIDSEHTSESDAWKRAGDINDSIANA